MSDRLEILRAYASIGRARRSARGGFRQRPLGHVLNHARSFGLWVRRSRLNRGGEFWAAWWP